MISKEAPFQLSEELSITMGEWNDQAAIWAENITEWEVVMLSLLNNQRATLAKEISHLYFPVLTFLNLNHNAIQSAQALCSAKMPHLQSLYLCENNITSLRVLRKAVWPELQVLIINKNYFNDANRLAQGSFAGMKVLYVYGWGDKNKFTDHSFPAKMQTQSLNSLCIYSDKFCFHRSISATLNRRWQDVIFQ